MRTIHLIRHGEVHNPDHVVYADLDGFGLSELGRQQARAAAARLAETDVRGARLSRTGYIALDNFIRVFDLRNAPPSSPEVAEVAAAVS